eukprot:scaffold180443_cov31-Tisochrysis_lutea.AAC.4
MDPVIGSVVGDISGGLLKLSSAPSVAARARGRCWGAMPSCLSARYVSVAEMYPVASGSFESK